MIYSRPDPGSEFCTVVKQIVFVEFRLWETLWNNAVRAAESMWTATGLDKICEQVEAVKCF